MRDREMALPHGRWCSEVGRICAHGFCRMLRPCEGWGGAPHVHPYSWVALVNSSTHVPGKGGGGVHHGARARDGACGAGKVARLAPLAVIKARSARPGTRGSAPDFKIFHKINKLTFKMNRR